MNWKKITNHLYKNIKPIEGRIGSMIQEALSPEIQFSNFWIDFDMNEFMYEDPFYGKQKSTAPFNMFIDLIDFATYNRIKEINEFENKYFENKHGRLNGAFSNSLDIITKYIKFGKINGDRIEFEMKYSITNSDSYGMMNGTYEEHIEPFGMINIPLRICDLVMIVQTENGLKKLTDKLNPNIYDLKSIRCTQEKTEDSLNVHYEISYKDIKAKGNNKK